MRWDLFPKSIIFLRARCNGHKWKKKFIPFGVDNQAFETAKTTPKRCGAVTRGRRLRFSFMFSLGGVLFTPRGVLFLCVDLSGARARIDPSYGKQMLLDFCRGSYRSYVYGGGSGAQPFSGAPEKPQFSFWKTPVCDN